jgi:hypothetical protein
MGSFWMELDVDVLINSKTEDEFRGGNGRG